MGFLRRSISEALTRHTRVAGVTDLKAVGDLASTAGDAEAKTCVQPRPPPSDLVCEAGVRFPRWDSSGVWGLPKTDPDQEVR